MSNHAKFIIGLFVVVFANFYFQSRHQADSFPTHSIVQKSASTSITPVVSEATPVVKSKNSRKPKKGGKDLVPKSANSPSPQQHSVQNVPTALIRKKLGTAASPQQYSYTPVVKKKVRKARSMGCTYSGNELNVGPRGGCFYYTSSGRKEYVDRSYCSGCY